MSENEDKQGSIDGGDFGMSEIGSEIVDEFIEDEN